MYAGSGAASLKSPGGADSEVDSVQADKKRLAEVNRMIRSYESQTKPSALGAASASASSVNEEEDEYLDDADFAASGDAIEESIEVEEEIASMSHADDGADGDAGQSKTEDSMADAEYFASGVSEKAGGGSGVGVRQQVPMSTGGRRTHSLASGALDGSEDSVDYDDRDPADLYSEDASVNEPLETQYDYTEEVELQPRR